MKKLDYIYSLRGLAVLGVLMIHCGHYGNNNYPLILDTIIGNGGAGVQLFYVISALTLFMSLHNRREIENNPIRNFFIRRFFRIAPMYYIAIIYYLIQDGTGARFWLGDAPNISNANIASNIFFLHGLNPYWINSVVPGGWSIAIEMMFYCLIPFLFQRITTLHQATIFFIFSLCINWILQILLPHLNIISSHELWMYYLYFFLPSQLPVFASGIILYFLITTPHIEWNIKPKIIGILSILFTVHLTTTFKIFPIHIQFGLLFILVGYYFSKTTSKFVINKLIVYIGKISYSMYLTHFAIIFWMTKFGVLDILSSNSKLSNSLNFGIRYGILLLATVLISTLFYNLVEMPCIALGKNIIKRHSKR